MKHRIHAPQRGCREDGVHTASSRSQTAVAHLFGGALRQVDLGMGLSADTTPPWRRMDAFEWCGSHRIRDAPADDPPLGSWSKCLTRPKGRGWECVNPTVVRTCAGEQITLLAISTTAPTSRVKTAVVFLA